MHIFMVGRCCRHISEKEKKKEQIVISFASLAYFICYLADWGSFLPHLVGASTPPHIQSLAQGRNLNCNRSCQENKIINLIR